MPSGARYFLPSTRQPSTPDLGVVFVGLFFGYVALLGLAHGGQSGLLKALANAYAVSLFGLLAAIWLATPLKPRPFGDFAAVLSVFYVGMACSLLVNPHHIQYGDLLKTLLVPAFVAIGAAAQRGREQPLWSSGFVRTAFWAMLAIPLAVFAVQIARTGVDFSSAREAGIFSNRNNAGLYAVTMIGLYGVLSGRVLRSVVLLLMAGVMFATLGLVLAVALALLIAVGRWRDLAVLGLCVLLAAVGYQLFPDFGPYQRVEPVVKSVQYLADGRIDLRTVTFGQLVLLLGTTDLSFLFRLKHWLDLWDIMVAANPYHWLFGFGVNASVRLSEMHLVPHNDYLRIGFEYGLMTLVGFLGLLTVIYRRLGLNWATVPLLAVTIYFFSENLITNYTAMAIFFFTAGALCQRKADQTARHTGDREGG